MSGTRRADGSLSQLMGVSFALHLTLLLCLGGMTIFRSLSRGSAEFEVQPPQVEPPRAKEYQVRLQKSQRSSASPAPPRLNLTEFSEFTLNRVVLEVVEPVKHSIRGRGQRRGVGLGGGDGLGLGGGMSMIPKVFTGRCDPDERLRRLERNGGSIKSERAVEKGLRWLKKEQERDGSWGQRRPVAMTALALLAYLGHCETPDSSEFGNTVKGAIDYLVKRSGDVDGVLCSANNLGAGNDGAYEHGIAVYALAEAYALTRDCRNATLPIEPALRKGTKYIVDGQTPRGGWLYRYEKGNDGDLSVAGWQVQALKAVQRTALGLEGVGAALGKARGYVETVEDGQGFFKYRMGDGNGKISLCGTGLVCLQMLGGEPRNRDAGFSALVKARPERYPGDLYAWYYQNQAVFNRGEDFWRRWNETFLPTLVDAQKPSGAWPKGSVHSGGLGPDADLYSTSLCILMLEVYYRYLDTGKK